MQTGLVTCLLGLAGCATNASSPVELAAATASASPAPAPITTSQQWLFGSAESAVLTRQTFDALTAYALGVHRTHWNYPARRVAKVAAEPPSVLLEAGASLAAPRFAACASKPPAVVFDADETLIWNLGSARWLAERGRAFDPAVWAEWERTGAGKALPLPGALEAVNKLRAAGLAIIVNTNREAANVAGTVETLRTAGFGEFRHGETLFLKGDDQTGSSKDARRAVIASRYCVIAMAGDQLGDFSQGFNDRALSAAQRRALIAGPTASLWGRGWFMLPNPTYGPWDKITYDEAYPPETRWEPEEGR
jgi:5'-nucleotidase (lipoprotein e(P4) family)